MLNLEVMLDEEKIQSRISELAKEIDEDYNGKNIIVVCVLRGAIYFTVDLTKKMKTQTELDFVKVSSYDGTESTGRIDLKLELNIENRDVLIVEDIIDTGYTLKFLKEYIMKKNPKSLKIAVLLDKEERRKVKIDVDYIGFKIPNKYVVGYGFDYNNTYRNLPYIANLKS